MIRKKLWKRLTILCITGIICLSGCGKPIEVIQEDSNQLVGEEVSEDIIKEDLLSKEAEVVEEIKEQPSEVVAEIQEEEVATEESKEEPIVEETKWDKEENRVRVKGIYVSGPVAGIKKMDELISLVDETELNAMVIDIKNDEGLITYKMDSPLVNEVGSQKGYIRDIEALVQKCKEKNIYLIARIVAFKDPTLAEAKPELAIQLKSGGIYRDAKGLAWVNPYKKEVWEYLKEIAIEAANVGFDEVQFDYIRFSTDVSSGKVDYGEEALEKSKTDIITEFTKYICEELQSYEVYVAADVYGTVIDSKVDQNIVGQDYVLMSSYLDYICPMVYPSHYANGVYGLAVPDAEPYKLVNRAMLSANNELEALGDGHKAIGRVWLQSFTASWVKGHISYGPQQIRDQIKGAFDAGYDEWILWNAAINYQRNSLRTDEEAEIEEAKWRENLTNIDLSPNVNEATDVKEDEKIETAELTNENSVKETSSVLY